MKPKLMERSEHKLVAEFDPTPRSLISVLNQNSGCGVQFAHARNT